MSGAATGRRATRRLRWVLIPAVLVATACGNRAGPDPNATAQGSTEAQTDSGYAATPDPATQAPVADPGAPVPADAPAVASESPPVASGGGAVAAPKAGTSSGGKAATPGQRSAAQAPGNVTSGGAATSGAAATSGGGAAAPAPSAAAAPAPGSPAPGAGAAPAPTGNKPPVIIGNFGTWSGVFGGIGIPELHGVKAWVGDVNARGGLNGHPVKLVSYDDGGEPGRALSSAQRLVEQDKAIAILGVFAPTTEQAVTAYLEQKKVPLIVTCNCAPADDLSPMIFPIGPGALGNAWQHSLPLITGVDQEIRDNMGLLFCQEAPICPEAAKNIETFQEAGNFKIVWKAQASLAAPDYTSEILAARNAGVKAIFEVMDNHSVLRIQRAANRQGYKILHNVQFSMYDARFEKAPELEGIVFTSSPTPMWSLSPKMADYREALKKYVPGGIGAAWGAEAYVGGKLLEKLAVNFSPNPTPADVLKGLWSLRNETLGGLLPGITYYEGETHRYSNLCMVPVVIKGGKFVPRDGDPDKFICAPGWQPGMHN